MNQRPDAAMSTLQQTRPSIENPFRFLVDQKVRYNQDPGPGLPGLWKSWNLPTMMVG